MNTVTSSKHKTLKEQANYIFAGLRGARKAAAVAGYIAASRKGAKRKEKVYPPARIGIRERLDKGFCEPFVRQSGMEVPRKLTAEYMYSDDNEYRDRQLRTERHDNSLVRRAHWRRLDNFSPSFVPNIDMTLTTGGVRKTRAA